MNAAACLLCWNQKLYHFKLHTRRAPCIQRPLLFSCTHAQPTLVLLLSPYVNTHSFEAFVDAVRDIKAGKATPEDFDGALATIGTTFLTTAILEAGRRSLDDNSRPYDILYEGADKELPSGLKAAVF
jgi:hypothetical protein